MVKEIDENEMKASVAAATALKKSVSVGMGDPLSLRIADALLEVARNVQVQIDSAHRLYSALAEREEAVRETLEQSGEAAKHAEDAAEAASGVSIQAMEAIEKGTREVVSEAFPEELDELVLFAQRQIAEAAADAAREIQSAASQAGATISQVNRAADDMKLQARKAATFSHLPLIVRVTLVLIVLAFVACCVTVGRQVMPLATGQVEIVYSDDFRSELDATRLELAKTRNELDAYKKAYPEGLLEKSVHDLNVANQQAQDAYEGESS